MIPIRSAVLLCGLLAACAPASRSEEGPAPAARARAIVDGTEDSGDPAVVAIGARRIGCGEALGVRCTGTLIAPQLVLTAAHCVKDPRLGSDLEVLFGSDAAAPDARVQRVAAVHTHPDYRADGDAADLAILVLAEAAPVAPVPLGSASLAGAAGRSVRIVGFGQTRASGEPPRTKRSGTARISEIRDAIFLIAPGPSLSCRGDSGGPLFDVESGREVLIGVTSTGDPGCATYGRNVRVDAFARDFIRPWIDRERDRPAPPAPAPRSEPALDGSALCSSACSSDRDCPGDLVCQVVPVDADQELAPRCVVPGLLSGNLADSCTSDPQCGNPERGDRCVHVTPDTCRCLRSCSALPSEQGGCGVTRGAAPSGSGSTFLLSCLLLFLFLFLVGPATQSRLSSLRGSCRR